MDFQGKKINFIESGDECDKVFMDNSEGVIMIFWEKCGFCHTIAPKFAQLEENNKYAIDIEQFRDTEELERISAGFYKGSVPLILMFKTIDGTTFVKQVDM
jgi:thiol-disulfide isomerase/thioredoxin